MQVQVTITHELGESVKAFIGALVNANGGQVAAGVSKAPSNDETADAPKTKRSAAPSAPVVDERDEAPARRRGPAKVEEDEVEEDEAPARRGRPAAKVEDAPAPARRGRPAKVEEPEEDEAPAARRGRPAAKVEEKKEPNFADMSKAEQLEEIKQQITLTTKKKGGAQDVRDLLGVFDAGRAGELKPNDYVEFWDALSRYRKGESVDEIFPALD